MLPVITLIKGNKKKKNSDFLLKRFILNFLSEVHYANQQIKYSLKKCNKFLKPCEFIKFSWIKYKKYVKFKLKVEKLKEYSAAENILSIHTYKMGHDNPSSVLQPCILATLSTHVCYFSTWMVGWIS